MIVIDRLNLDTCGPVPQICAQICAGIWGPVPVQNLATAQTCPRKLRMFAGGLFADLIAIQFSERKPE